MNKRKARGMNDKDYFHSKGAPTSGNYGHAGRPPLVGGSGQGGGGGKVSLSGHYGHDLRHLTDKVWDGMSDGDRREVLDYLGSRTGHEGVLSKLTNTSLGKDYRVYAALDNVSDSFLDKIAKGIGSKISFKNFLSTSTDRGVIGNILRSGGVLVSIVTNRGLPVGHRNTLVRNEKELILGKRSQYRVLGYRRLGLGGRKNLKAQIKLRRLPE